MPVDSRDKRASVLGMANPPFVVFPNPHASIVLADRQQAAYTYRGIAASVQVTVRTRRTVNEVGTRVGARYRESWPPGNAHTQSRANYGVAVYGIAMYGT